MSEKKSILSRLFSWIRGIFNFLRTLVLLVVLLMFGSMAYLVWQGGPPVKVEDGVAMVLVPFGQIVDSDDSDPRTKVAEELLGEEPSTTVLADMLDAMDSAAKDPRIKLLFLKLDTGFWAGQAQLAEIAAGIQRFKASGKPVYAYAPQMGQQEYFLASAADKIFIDPMGMVFLEGYENYPLYFDEALDKLGVNVNVFRVGEFKSAVEPFTRNSMSDAARQNAQQWLDGLWASWLGQVANMRGVSEETLLQYNDNFVQGMREHQGDSAAYAKAAGLVDEVLPLTAIREMTGELVGMDKDHDSFRQIDHARYLHALWQSPIPSEQAKENNQVDKAAPKNAIAVVVVQGEIVDGISGTGYAGGDTISGLIRDAADKKHVKALVLRVDSPGGSVYASEQIRREVEAFRESGRPVVVSMSSVAASGGYWVSMNANRIVAHESTITGSIGVFGLIPTFEDSLGKLGVHSDGVGTTIWSGGLSGARPLGEPIKQAIQLMVEKDYRRFIEQVATAREMTVEDVDAIAQGQVWTGKDALAHGLVDELGDGDQAVARAAELASLEEGDYYIEPFAPVVDIRMQILDRFSYAWMPAGVADVLGGWLRAAERVMASWSDRRGVYAHCLCVPK